MKYEQSIVIETHDKRQEIIRLFDLDQALVLDYNEDENHIFLTDMTSGKVLNKFPYGNGGYLEGFSFAVSPRHNYLIVKEVVYGESYDNLYATLYRLKNISLDDDECKQLKQPIGAGRLMAVKFESYYYLRFLFGDGEHETSIWLQGQSVDNLEVIECYQYGGRKAVEGYPQSYEALLYKVNAYPAVALDPDIRDGVSRYGLSPHTVVNDLATVKRNQLKALSALELNDSLKRHLKALYTRHDEYLMQHIVLASSCFKSDIEGFNVGFKTNII